MPTFFKKLRKFLNYGKIVKMKWSHKEFNSNKILYKT